MQKALTCLVAIFAVFSLPLVGSEPKCEILIAGFSEVRVVNLPSLHSDLLRGAVLKIGDTHYAIPEVHHLVSIVGGQARLAWKQALGAARVAGPNAEKLCRKTMSDLLLAYFTKEEGYTETYEIQTPGGRTTKYVLPDGTVIHLAKPESKAAMRAIQIALR